MSPLDLKAIRQREQAATKGPWVAYYTHADTDFIAHAREDVPALLSVVERMAAALRRYGQHKVDCAAFNAIGPSILTEAGKRWRPPSCTCGFAAALGLVTGLPEEGTDAR